MFTGLATFTPNVFDSLAEDVSTEVGLISPSETPLLSLLGDARDSAHNILHEWLEDELTPTAITNSSGIVSLNTDTPFGVANNHSAQMQIGQILTRDYKEHFSVTAINGSTITVSRGFGGTMADATSIGPAQTLQIISEAALEGDDVSRDLSVGRPRKSNHVQIFKRDIILSGTRTSVQNLGGISDEMAYQRTKRIKEMLVQLERTLLVGLASGNGIGSATAQRTTKGLRSFIQTNVASLGVVAMTAPRIEQGIKLAWDKGATDVSLLLSSTQHKSDIDALNASRIRVVNTEDKFRQAIDEYEGTYGIQRVMMNRWMPPSETFAIAPGRVKILPLSSRTFQYQTVAKTGDSQKGFVVGEYVVEVKNEEGMARLETK